MVPDKLKAESSKFIKTKNEPSLIIYYFWRLIAWFVNKFELCSKRKYIKSIAYWVTRVKEIDLKKSDRGAGHSIKTVRQFDGFLRKA